VSNERVAKKFDVLVIGAGPAGLAAAACAGECGATVAVVDDNPAPGGQIWRGESASTSSDAAAWSGRLRAVGVQECFGARVVHQPEPGVLLAEGANNLFELSFRKLIVATGARELFLPFPGWTLPNVMGAGGLQALVKSGLPIAGKRVLVAGSGPLLLAVAAYLRHHGAEIPMICEQASRRSLARFGFSLLRQPGKIRQGFSLRQQLSGIPFLPTCWPVEARGHKTLEEVVISQGSNRQTKTISCDYLACGFHLVPNTELAELLGCRVGDGLVQVDDLQQTSVPGVFCAGEPTGVGGVELALVEGQIAGLAAGGHSESAKRFFGERKKLRSFAHALDRAFALRPGLRRLPLPATIVCRCEDVTYSRLTQYRSWRAAKLQTRCGMGPCQGRVCGPATRFLFDWLPDSVRPPIFPTRFESLSAITLQEHTEPSQVTGGRT
jgi:NADPH-dependent 2,4-dienoyl-CoA reductase/sulfur reductase-like enzyme